MNPGRPADPHPTGRELDVLASLWVLEEARVEAVRQDLEERFEYLYAYSTVLTMLRRMEAKGWVTRYKDGLGHIYVPRLSREDVRREALRRLLYSAFDGSTETMIATMKRMFDPNDR